MPLSDYTVTIGLEIHCQIKTKSKMFCSCKAESGDEPNTHVCPVCLGLPGALPVLNKYAIEQTILTGLMLGCSTPSISKWDRKSYFYPDMPKNYQTTQLDLPLCIGGAIPLFPWCYPTDMVKKKGLPEFRSAKLDHIHLEEDAGKLTHHASYSLIDYNRAGTPLMEIVTAPDMHSPEEAYACLKSLQLMVIYGGISDADMEKGQMRCDVNVSLFPKGQQGLGSKIEMKNINSTGAVRRALEYEIRRQSEELDMGIDQVQSTRRWDDERGESILMRTKENAHDYRYFTCPDLVPIHTANIVTKMETQVPEHPMDKQQRFIRDFAISEYDANVLVADPELARYFEAAATQPALGKKIANWVINVVAGLLNEKGISPSQCPVQPTAIAGLVTLVEDGTVSNNQAREVLMLLWNQPELEPAVAAKQLGFEKTDTSFLDGIIDKILAINPDKAVEISSGNAKLLNWLTGQVMREVKGKANPKMVTETLRRKLGLN